MNFFISKKQNQQDILINVPQVRTLILNGVSVSDTRIEHRRSYDTRRTHIHEVSNSKSICWISDKSSTVLTQF